MDSCEEVAIGVFCNIEGTDAEIGNCILDICAIENFYKGIIIFNYRCLKSIFCLVDLYVGYEPYEQLALSFAFPQPDKPKSSYFPCKDYPVDMRKYFTPNFSLEKYGSKQDFKENGVDLIETIKNPKTSYSELLEYLYLSQPEIIYHTLERFQYFATQSSYALLLIQDTTTRLKEILGIFCKDKLIICKSL